MPIKKKYCNGSDKFLISLVNPGDAPTVENLNFSFRYQALNEYDTTQITRHLYYDGSKSQLPHFVNLEWEIDFSGLLDEDHSLINRLKNAKFEGKRIILTPHIDVERSFEVQLIEGERRKLGQYYNDRQDGANKDYVLWLENVSSILRHNWIDVYEAEIGAQYPIILDQEYLSI